MTDQDTPRPEPSAADQPPAEEGKIHVDSDWKKEAQAEKQRLAREAEAAEPSAGGPGAEPGADQALPQASFASLVQMLATQAAIFMSDQRDPQTGRSMQHLDLAKHNIDLLAVLEQKTKGNLADDEKKLLDHMLYELRMVYVSVAS
ncbi:MAG TPA: DUF1844 domain-containing protein [Phycisphaerae bacterium]|nr:DUF1844 domain-containing protein [Phycisphaerae bacterium]